MLEAALKVVEGHLPRLQQDGAVGLQDQRERVALADAETFPDLCRQHQPASLAHADLKYRRRCRGILRRRLAGDPGVSRRASIPAGHTSEDTTVMVLMGTRIVDPTSRQI